MIPPIEILEQWNLTAGALPSPDAGLINDTFVVQVPEPGVLQRVNPIFKPTVHLDIEAITKHIDESGMLTPRLVRTIKGELCVPTEHGAWRLLTYVPGSTVHTISSPGQAASAAELVGRFHRALGSLNHTFHFTRPGAHDTVAHMNLLQETIAEAQPSDTLERVKPVAATILSRWEKWDGAIDLPQHICHGDLKISNVRFDHDRATAKFLLDFDTLSHQSYAVEMGDAWRSWCNPAGEDQPDAARFDLDIFEASVTAWLRAGPTLTDKERVNLVAGVERICLELAARFCADSIRQCYFKEDRTRFQEAGAHNLARAVGQLNVALSVNAQRATAEKIISSCLR